MKNRVQFFSEVGRRLITKIIGQAWRIISYLISFIHYVVLRIAHDRVNVNAGYLAYITLLSMVPMLAVLISILSSISAFSNVSQDIQSFIVSHFIPSAGEQVQATMTTFIENTRRMTAIGSGFLFIAAIMLMRNIDKNLNHIWRVKKKRTVVLSFSMYWTILTLGPIFIAASLMATPYVTSIEFIDGYQSLSSSYHVFLRYLPELLSFFFFYGLYIVVPNKPIVRIHAISGAIIASLLFETIKQGFNLYLEHFHTYELIYGGLAVIPILFIWVYLCWVIVLLGAEVTASLGEREHWQLNSSQYPYRRELQYVKNTLVKHSLIKKRGENSHDSIDSKSE